jgi:hypothetical protein
MIRKILMFTMVMVLGTASYVGAACTPEEMQAKAMAFQQAATATAQKDAKKYQDVMTTMQKELAELQKANDMDAMCKFYDDLTAKLQ